ncbi:MAG TPA: nicotinate-nucleotide adenylyltransferase [Bryobacteraceae bacterium]|nr:nicotinate-nucleotide adenylyltransferase [Bryobacteraceae bacterium]
MPESTHSGRRICLFGGTFDPVHFAHLRVAQEALKQCHLNGIVFIPAGVPPHKAVGRVTPYEDRLHMVEIACAPYPEFEVSRLEEGTRRSYTIETVERFRKMLSPADELFFLIGADAFNEIESWHRWQDLIQLIEFIVVTRPGGCYKVPPGAQVQKLNGLELPISSSAIRARLAARKPTPELPDGVRAFIEERGLYLKKRKTTVLR